MKLSTFLLLTYSMSAIIIYASNNEYIPYQSPMLSDTNNALQAINSNRLKPRATAQNSSKENLNATQDNTELLCELEHTPTSPQFLSIDNHQPGDTCSIDMKKATLSSSRPSHKQATSIDSLAEEMRSISPLQRTPVTPQPLEHQHNNDKNNSSAQKYYDMRKNRTDQLIELPDGQYAIPIAVKTTKNQETIYMPSRPHAVDLPVRSRISLACASGLYFITAAINGFYEYNEMKPAEHTVYNFTQAPYPANETALLKWINIAGLGAGTACLVYGLYTSSPAKKVDSVAQTDESTSNNSLNDTANSHTYTTPNNKKPFNTILDSVD